MKLNYQRAKTLTFIQSSRLNYGCKPSCVVSAIDVPDKCSKGEQLTDWFDSRRQARKARSKAAQSVGIDIRYTRILSIN